MCMLAKPASIALSESLSDTKDGLHWVLSAAVSESVPVDGGLVCCF